MTKDDRRVLDIGTVIRYGISEEEIDEALTESNLVEETCTLTEAYEAVKVYATKHGIPRQGVK